MTAGRPRRAARLALAAGLAGFAAAALTETPPDGGETPDTPAAAESPSGDGAALATPATANPAAEVPAPAEPAAANPADETPAPAESVLAAPAAGAAEPRTELARIRAELERLAARQRELRAAVAKLAFDSLVQRDAPDANHGRFFSRFEARFQIAWVAGAFAPAVVPIPARIGSLMAAMAVGFALFSYMLGRTGRRSLSARLKKPPAPEPAAGDGDDADDGRITAEEIRATQPATPAGLSEMTVLAAGDPEPLPPLEYDAPAAADPTDPPPPWWTDPLVSTVEGVEVEEDRD